MHNRLTEGTIIKGVGGQYTVDTADARYVCNARGLFRKLKQTPLVGDRVLIETADNAATGTLMKLLPRHNALKRPPVANADQVVIVMAAVQPAPNLALLDLYLMQTEYEGIEAAICINKADLDAGQMAGRLRAAYAGTGYPFFAVSAEDGTGMDAFYAFLHRKTTVLAGPSGVGKSSLINALLQEAVLATGGLSQKIGRGKHTTRHSELVPVSGNGYVIDTPGFSRLELPEIPPSRRAALFREFQPFLGQCKFTDCLHRAEQDCAVKAEIPASISPERYARYLEVLEW